MSLDIIPRSVDNTWSIRNRHLYLIRLPATGVLTLNIGGNRHEALLVISLLTICLLTYSTVFAADPPRLISYQGRMTDSGGSPVDTTVDITFAIFSDSLAADKIWEEVHSGVPIKNGLFEVLLGSSEYLKDDVLDGTTRWLGIAIDGGGLMMPLEPVVSSAYAIRAERAGYALSIANNSVNSSKIISNGVYPSDILAEPGLSVDAELGYGISMNTTWKVVARSEISCPAAGYVVALSTMIGATMAYDSKQAVMFGITTDTTELPPDDTHQWDVPRTSYSQYARGSLVAQRVTEIPSAGDYTFYLIARKLFDVVSSTSVDNARLNLMYFPTAYGTVESQSY